jgi:D-lactate dehydrogenase
MQHQVYFFEVFEEEREALTRYLPKYWEVGFTDKTIQESGCNLPPARVISIRTQSVIPLLWSSHLDGILSRSAGYDHLTRFLASASKPMSCGHLFRYSGRAVAEHAAMMWLALLRRLPRQQQAIRTFQRDHMTGYECKGRTLAVFGVGDIGYQVGQIGCGLGMKVIGVDVEHRHQDVHYVDKLTAVTTADIIVCSMNLNETNRGYFSPEVIAMFRPETIFINVARGEFALSSDLLQALRGHRLGGVGLDVYAEESTISPALRSGVTSDHPEWVAFKELLTRDDVIMTPHNAFNTVESLSRKSEQSVRQLQHFFTHGVFSTSILQEP